MGAQATSSEYRAQFMTNHRESLSEVLRKRKGAPVTLSEYGEEFMTNHCESLHEDLRSSSHSERVLRTVHDEPLRVCV